MDKNSQEHRTLSGDLHREPPSKELHIRTEMPNKDLKRELSNPDINQKYKSRQKHIGTTPLTR